MGYQVCLLRVCNNARDHGIENLTCMAFSGTGSSEVVAAGTQGNVLLLNIDRGSVIKQVTLRENYSDYRNRRRSGTPNLDEDESSVELQLVGILS